MSTNRTKIDWAYRQADKLVCRTAFKDQNDRISKIAAALRLAKRRGMREVVHPDAVITVGGQPLTVATIRKCKEQLMNNKPFVPEPTDPCKRCRAPQWAHDDHEALSCGNFIPEGPQ